MQQILTALLTSAAWPDSVFILTWDEGGGWFDHVGPVLVTPPDDVSPVDLSGHTQGLFNVTGFRVPMMVVSPWVKPHTVSHLPTDYTAMLKLIETRFDAPALTQRDATADDMADPTNGLFDFSTPHLLQVPAPALPTRPMARVTRHWRARRIRHGEGRAAVGWVGRVDGSLQRCCGAKGKGLRELQSAEAVFVGQK